MGSFFQPPDPSTQESNSVVTTTKKFIPELFKSIPFAGSVIGSGLDFLFGSIAKKKERKLAVENWRMQNEYNSPASQLARYKAAGVNPRFASDMHLVNTGATLSDDANKVYKPDIGSQTMNNLANYIDIKHNQAEMLKSQEQLQQEHIKTNILRNTESELIQQAAAKTTDMTAKSKLSSYSEWVRSQMLGEGLVTETLNYQKDAQKMRNDQALTNLNLELGSKKSGLLDLEKALKNFELEDAKTGINKSDSTFLRALRRMQGGSKDANNLFPYVIGDRFSNFAGDLMKIGIPSGVLKSLFSKTGKAKAFNYKSPSSKIPPQYY